jgi:hypothetical protein
VGRRVIVAISVFVILIGFVIIPVKAQSDVSLTQEFILDSAMGDTVYSMILDTQGDMLIVGDRIPTNANDSFWLEGMLLKVTNQGAVSEIFKLDNNEVSSLTDLALDSSGNIILAGKGGEWEGRQFGYMMKLSNTGEVIWTVEFPEIYFRDYVGIEVNQTTGDVYFVGSALYGQDGVFLSKVNSTGFIEWEQIWYREGYLDQPYTTHSLYQVSQGLLLGVDRGISSQITSFAAELTVAFASNGTELWTHYGEFEVLQELENGRFLCAGGESALMCDSDLSPIWETEIELHCDYRPRITGYDVNSTGGILAYGSVIGFGESPVKGGFSLSYTPALIPQTLIVSINEEGDVEWYDFYISGDRSVPCGASFDQDGGLVLAGYNENYSADSEESNIWTLWNFVPTPFPDIIICDEEPIFFGISLIPVAIVLSWGLYRARKGRVTEDLILGKAIKVFRKGGIIFAILFFGAFGFVSGPIPSPVIMLSLYGFLSSLLFIVASYIMEYLAKHGKEEPEYEPIYHYYQQES